MLCTLSLMDEIHSVSAVGSGCVALAHLLYLLLLFLAWDVEVGHMFRALCWVPTAR